GLNEPAFQRFIGWLVGLATGDMGRSYVNDIEIVELLGGRLQNSLRLAGIVTVICVPVALTLGIIAAMFRGSWLDRAVSVATISVISVPEFMVATLSVLVFAVWLGWLPALSYGVNVDSIGAMLRAYAMPVITLSFVVSAQMIRMTRAAVIETIETPYVEMALLKGASKPRMVLVHALPNALGPIANAVALSLSYLVGGVIIVETVFNYPGVAKLMVDAVATRDLPLIQSCAMVFCVSYLTLITLADMIAILSNPRLRQ
ncbi:MAG: ABC transporter permease, partial [Roseovarius sp.]